MIVQQKDTEKSFAKFLKLKNLNQSTKDCYLRYWRLFMPIITELGLEQEVIDTWLLEHKNHKQIRAFVRNYLDHIDNTEIRLVKKTGNQEPKKRLLPTDSQMKAITNYLYEHNWKYGLLIDLLVATAIRRAEVLTICPEHFEWERWWENQELQCRLVVIGKGRKERIVTVPSRIMKNLKKYANDHTIQEGQPYIKTNRTSLTEQFENACEVLYKKKYTLHDIRRYTANKWYRNGLTLDQIKIRLGHKSVKTTELYVQAKEMEEIDIWENEKEED